MSQAVEAGPCRIRVRKLGSIPPNQRTPLRNRYWAWSRPHVAEEIGRFGDQLRRHGPEGLAKEVHFHALDADCPNRDCLLLDTVLAVMPLGADEVEVK